MPKHLLDDYADMSAAPERSTWEIRKDMALTFAAIATPLVVATIGAWYNIVIKESENRVRYVELAISQLSEKPSPTTAALRNWAIDLLDSQSPIKLTPEAKEQLRSQALLISATAKGASLSSGIATLSAGVATGSSGTK